MMNLVVLTSLVSGPFGGSGLGGTSMGSSQAMG